MRKVVVCLLVMTVAVGMAAQSTKGGKAQEVTYTSGNEQVKAFLYTPEGKGPFPAVVVIHEWWGLDDWVKEQAQKLANRGYVAIAVDLYRGNSTRDPDEAHQLSRGLPEDRAMRDLKGAFEYLASQKNVDAKRIGSVGWCMGGGYSLALAQNEPRLKAAIIAYGRLATEESSLKNVNASMLGVFGGQDKGIPLDSVKAFEKQMKDLGKNIEVVVYPDAGHAFMNPNNKKGYRAQDAADAWKRMLVFFDRELKGVASSR